METQNPFTNCKLVGFGIDSDAYHRQEAGIVRGDPRFVISRSHLAHMAPDFKKWKGGTDEPGGTGTVYGLRRDVQELSPELFDKKYAVAPETYPATKTSTAVKDGECEVGDPIPWSGRATFCKEWKKKQGEKIIISMEHSEEDLIASRSLHADTRIEALMSCSKFQAMVVGEYRDPETGIVIPVRTLIDGVPTLGSNFAAALWDYKTARNTHKSVWWKVCDSFWYDAQAGMNLMLWNAATGENRNQFYQILQQNKAPFGTGRRMLAAEDIEDGKLKIVLTLAAYARCLSTGKWPDCDESSPYDGWTICQRPAWATGRDLTGFIFEPIPELEEAKPEPADHDVGH